MSQIATGTADDQASYGRAYRCARADSRSSGDL